MSDRMAAEIWIGGKIPATLVPDLCAAIRTEGLATQWGDAPFKPTCAEELLAVSCECPQAPKRLLVWLCDDEQPWGEFEALESFLQEHNIPYDRYTDGRYEYDCELVQFRPGLGLQCCVTNKAGQPLVDRAEVAAVLTLLERSQHARAVNKLRKLLSPTVPALPSFAIETKAPAKANPRRRRKRA